jgi:putative ABC transport system permease protein
MRWFDRLFRKTAAEKQLDSELRFHLEQRVAENIAAGMSPEEAQRRARIEFGGMEAVKEDCREARRVHIIETLLQDVRYGVRMLAKKPGFTAVAVLSLTLGIGANTTIFTLVKAVFLQSVPVKDPGRVVAIFSTNDLDRSAQAQFIPISVPNVLDYRDNVNVFSAASLVLDTEVALDVSGNPVPLFGQLVNWDFFDVVGVQPVLGRGFTPAEDQSPRSVVVISNALWQSQFGARRDIIGQNIELNTHDYTVIGVMPPEFHNVGSLGNSQLWIPQMMHDQVLSGLQKEWFTKRQGGMAGGVARLKPGVTFSQAQQVVQAFGTQLEREYPHDNAGRRAVLIPIDQTTIPVNQRSLFVLAGTLMMVVVGLVLLIACANVANLLLARATQRRREVAIRLALGASRGRLIRQLLTESLLLGFLAAGFGILFAKWTRPALFWLLPGGRPNNLDVSLDLRVLGFTLGLSLLATILFGLVPAIQASNPNRIAALRDRTDAPSGSSRWYGLRGALVMTQVAFSLIALIGAGLFIHSLRNAQFLDPGFDVAHSLVIDLDTTAQKYPQARAEQFYRNVVERVRALPGVAAASITDASPFSEGLHRGTFKQGVDSTDLRNGEQTPIIAVAPGYFSAAGIHMVRGRDFTDHDDANSQLVAVVNQALVDHFWPSEDPLGKHLRFYKEPWDVAVIGVVRTVKYATLGEPPQPIVYFALKQQFAPDVLLSVRTFGDVKSALPSVRASVQSLDPAMQLGFVSTVQALVDDNLTAAKLGAELLAAFGVLALVLAAVGTYGVMSYTVGQRTQEIGIRMALGAKPADVLRLILGGGMAMVLGGIAAGLVVSVFLTRSVSSLLYGIGAFDPIAFAITSALLLGVALVACLLPARRAMRVDPMLALRHE